MITYTKINGSTIGILYFPRKEMITCTVCNGHKKDCPACKGTGTLESVKVNVTK